MPHRENARKAGDEDKLACLFFREFFFKKMSQKNRMRVKKAPAFSYKLIS
jgi:hypothetical protein